MSAEQAQALRRKVGGTAKDYWKGWVEVKGNYVDKVRCFFFQLFFLLSCLLSLTPFPSLSYLPFQGYVSDDDDAVSAPPGIIFLVLTLVGLGAATAAVVSKVG